MTLDEIVTAIVSSGYRKVSNRYRHVARVDTAEVRCYPHIPGRPLGHDYFRRVLSKDVLTLHREVFRRVPTSCHDETGLVPLAPNLAEAIEAMRALPESQ